MSTCSHYYVNLRRAVTARAHVPLYIILYMGHARAGCVPRRKSRGAKRNFPNAKRKNRYAKTQESECENARVGVRRRKNRYAKTQESECGNARVGVRKRKNRYAKTQESECGNAKVGMQKRKGRGSETQKRGGEEKRNRIAPKKTAILFLMSYPGPGSNRHECYLSGF